MPSLKTKWVVDVAIRVITDDANAAVAAQIVNAIVVIPVTANLMKNAIAKPKQKKKKQQSN
jgi:hypothetical protein